MRTRLALGALACALATVLPARAVAGSYAGQLGLRYDRAQSWSPSGETLVTPSLSLDGSAGADGFVYAPDLLTWSGSLSYGTVRDGADLGNTTNVLGYGLGLGLFQSGESRTPVAAFANRGTVDAAFDGPTGDRLTGTTTTTAYGFGGALNIPGRPVFFYGADRIHDENSGSGRAPSSSTTDSLHAALRHAAGPFAIGIDYGGRFRTGSIPVFNYDQHTVGFSGTASVGPRLSAFVQDQYQQQTATEADPSNPTGMTNGLQAGVRGVGTRTSEQWFVTYGYNHFFVESSTVARIEQFAHSIAGETDQAHTERISTRLFASANLSDLRAGTGQQIASGEAIGGTAVYSRPLAPANVILVEAGPTLGAIQPVDAQAEVAYGGQLRVRWTLEQVRSDLEYRIIWGTNLAAVRGTTLVQSLRFDYTRRLTPGARLVARATANASRADTELIGTTVSQSAFADGELHFGKERHRFSFGANYSAAPTLFANGSGSDGLFIPADFAARTWSAYVALGTRLTSRLSVEGGARYGSGMGGGLPDQREAGVFGTLTYSLGLLSLRIEDRFVAGGATSFDERSNFLYVLVSRTFGGRF